MSVIQVTDLTFGYEGSGDLVFDHVSFQIDSDWKLGLIGRNGRGKTTLLQLLMRKYAYQGTIFTSVEFDYFPYEIPDREKNTGDVMRSVCPEAEEWELLRELSALQVVPEVLDRPFCTLSGGEQTKVLLAALFLNEGRFLLIDEPTNHLDTRGRDAVAAYLRRKKSFILVSHDRRFLDGCVDHILSINKADIEVQSGNFSSWAENRQRQDAFENSQNERLKSEIQRMHQAAERTSTWSDRVEKSKNSGADASGLKKDKGYVGHKAAKMMKRAKTIENRRIQALEEKSQLLKNRECSEELKLMPLIFLAEQLVTFSGVSIHYDGRMVCGPIDLTVGRGERVALEGHNGTGKSSLLKLIVGEPVPHDGIVKKSNSLAISYVPQEASNLRGDLSDYARIAKIEESRFKTILRKMGFLREQFEKDMADFSAGQKKKVLLARSLCERAHLYVWDEPLNYIDVNSRMQIEQLLTDFQPSMIFVEHDRVFQGKIATRVVRLGD